MRSTRGPEQATTTSQANRPGAPISRYTWREGDPHAVPTPRENKYVPPRTGPKSPPTPSKKCGNTGGYQRHRELYEEPCDSCSAAQSVYQTTIAAPRRQAQRAKTGRR